MYSTLNQSKTRLKKSKKIIVILLLIAYTSVKTMARFASSDDPGNKSLQIAALLTITASRSPMVRIVIVGGGRAGIAAAQALAKDLTPNDGTEVIVFEKSKYYYHAVGTPRAVVDAEYTKKLFVPYDKAIPVEARSFVKIQRAIVTRIVPGNEVEYTPIGNDDEMVAGPVQRLSPGSTCTVPLKQPKNNFKRSTTEFMMAELRQQIENANSILIVGGGATGAGVAGEIKAKFPTKNVAIIEGKDKLLGSDNVREKFRSRLLQFLKRLDMDVVLGERLTERLNGNSFERRTLRTDKGRELISDIQLLCGGFSPTTELIKSLDESLVTPQGLIKVNSKLQLDDSRYANIYALGDANNNSAPKHMLFASQQGTRLGSELALVARKTQTNVSKDFPKVEVAPAMIPLGPNGGVSQLPIFGGVVYGNFVTRTFKSKEYFASFAWKNLNAEVPK
ncbi:Apoptosis-inducing factor B [Phytophthora citrophthora]|uniref:Apoptosis-inducing factor B n=1 Tax=Phytophthora citrophthora TaxID=4793 RepID=A0AAD9LPG6_9STRA|nr:Apoptosis-inducing factor B [Phytophthora citrophthora]